jgi:hypothetical protein
MTPLDTTPAQDLGLLGFVLDTIDRIMASERSATCTPRG